MNKARPSSPHMRSNRIARRNLMTLPLKAVLTSRFCSSSQRRDRRAEGGVEEPAIAGRRPGEAGDASRRKVIVGAVSHRVVVQRCGRRTNRGVITCRVMRVHFGVTMAEMHHEHSDTPTQLTVGLRNGIALEYSKSSGRSAWNGTTNSKALTGVSV